MKQTLHKAKQIADVLDGNHSISVPDREINNFIIDSRKGRKFETSLFVALEGSSGDGHQFIEEMYQKGVRNFLVSSPVKMFADANYFQVESIIESFRIITSIFKQVKTHQTQMLVDLDALSHNLSVYRGLLEPNVKTMVMVKAFGYGAGGFEVSRLLATDKVDYLGVAYADEGVTIRKQGVLTPIMVMNPMVEAFTSMINHNLEPEIYSLNVFNAYREVVNRIGGQNASYKIHLKLDTGMNRLGFKLNDLDSVLTILKHETHFKVASVFSHLAASDDADFDDFTNSQIALFSKLADEIESSLGYSFIKHISNTGGIERFENAQFDMVRLGIGLYGIAKESRIQNQLQTVSSLYSIIIQIKHIKKGESVGYNRAFVAGHDMKIAIVPIGYADGLNRKLGNQLGSVFVTGQKRPILGNISMDLIMVDITNLPSEINDLVEIFGENIEVQEVAELIDTISYEILSSISPRVKRVYIKDN